MSRCKSAKFIWAPAAACAAMMTVTLAGSPQVVAADDWLASFQAASRLDSKGQVLAQVDHLDTGGHLVVNSGIRDRQDIASGLPLMLADADAGAPGAEEPESSNHAKCAKFEKDKNADVGDIIRAGCQPTTAQMSALMDNPLGNVAMLFTQFDFTRMENQDNGESANKGNYMGIAQFPKGLGKDWNLINRFIWNVPSLPIDQDKVDDYGSGPGGGIMPPSGSPPAPIDLFDGRTTGFGDMYYVGLFSPKKPIHLDNGGKIVWGLGFDLGFPTATDDLLGTGKWTAGPSALGVYLGSKWKIGALAQQYWDYAGDNDRSSVNMTNLQYLYYYSLDATTSVGAGPNIIANWEQSSGNKFTVPVGIGINKTFQFGKIPVRIGAEVYYSVIKPDDVPAAEWDFRFYIIPAAPSALFKWMQ